MKINLKIQQSFDSIASINFDISLDILSSYREEFKSKTLINLKLNFMVTIFIIKRKFVFYKSLSSKSTVSVNH